MRKPDTYPYYCVMNKQAASKKGQFLGCHKITGKNLTVEYYLTFSKPSKREKSVNKLDLFSKLYFFYLPARCLGSPLELLKY